MTQNEPQIGGEVSLYVAPDGRVRLDVRLERDTAWLTQVQMAGPAEESNVQILHILRKSGYYGICAGNQAAVWGLRATVAKNATTAIYGLAGEVECLARKAAETTRERVYD
jgi:hypothetical protein